MGIVRGVVPVPYGRRGPIGPTEATVGGEWPLIKCWECDGWIDPTTREHVQTMSLNEALAQTEKEREP